MKSSMLMSPVVCVSTIFIGMVVNLIYVLFLLSDHWNYGYNPRAEHRRHERCVSFENHARNHIHIVAVFFRLGIALLFVNFPMSYQTQLVPYAFQVVFKHIDVYELTTQRLLSDFHQIYPLLLLTRTLYKIQNW